MIAREPQAAGGHTRLRLSNGWFIDHERRAHRRQHGHPYAAFAPGEDPGGGARYVDGDSQLRHLLDRLNHLVYPPRQPRYHPDQPVLLDGRLRCVVVHAYPATAPGGDDDDHRTWPSYVLRPARHHRWEYAAWEGRNRTRSG